MKHSGKIKSNDEFGKMIVDSDTYDENSYKEVTYGRQVYDLAKAPLYLYFLIFLTFTILALLIRCISSIESISSFLALGGIEDETIKRWIIAILFIFAMCNLIGIWQIRNDAIHYTEGFAKKTGLVNIALTYWILLGIVVIAFLITLPIYGSYFEFDEFSSVIVQMLYIVYFAVGACCIVILMLVQKTINNMSIYCRSNGSLIGMIVFSILLALGTFALFIKGERSITTITGFATEITIILLLLRYRRILVDL